MTCDLFLTACLTIHGPGYIAYTPLLERVAEHRLETGWGRLPADWTSFDVLVATPGCAQLGKSGWLITPDGVLSALVVDCSENPQAMLDRGLLADASRRGLNHQRAWLVLR